MAVKRVAIPNQGPMVRLSGQFSTNSERRNDMGMKETIRARDRLVATKLAIAELNERRELKARSQTFRGATGGNPGSLSPSEVIQWLNSLLRYSELDELQFPDNLDATELRAQMQTVLRMTEADEATESALDGQPSSVTAEELINASPIQASLHSSQGRFGMTDERAKAIAKAAYKR